MNRSIKQLGLTNAARVGWQSYARHIEIGVDRLCRVPAHMAFDRIDALATNSGEPMT